MTYNVGTADIEARWRPLSNAEADIATILLADATVRLNTARPSLAAAVASVDPLIHVDEQLVVICLCDMVIRVLANPDSFKATGIGADGSVTVTYVAIETLRPRIALAPGDLDNIDARLRVTGQGLAFFQSRVMRNVDYGVPTAPNLNILPTP